jgi:hypothetical protein
MKEGIRRIGECPGKEVIPAREGTAIVAKTDYSGCQNLFRNGILMEEK